VRQSDPALALQKFFDRPHRRRHDFSCSGQSFLLWLQWQAYNDARAQAAAAQIEGEFYIGFPLPWLWKGR